MKNLPLLGLGLVSCLTLTGAMLKSEGSSSGLYGLGCGGDLIASCTKVANVSNAGLVNVSGTTIPQVGIYAPAANRLGLSANTVKRLVVDSNGELSYYGTIPVVSACGTNSIDANATTSSGTVNITAGAPASCTITFANAFGTFDHCRVTPETTLAAFGYSYTLSALVVTGTALAGKIDYQCDGV
jgi:hypothetical protein